MAISLTSLLNITKPWHLTLEEVLALPGGKQLYALGDWRELFPEHFYSAVADPWIKNHIRLVKIGNYPKSIYDNTNYISVHFPEIMSYAEACMLPANSGLSKKIVFLRQD